MKLLGQRKLHAAFKISLALKGAFAFGEIVAGVFTYFVTQHRLLDLANAFTRTELEEDSRDFVANYLLHGAQHLSISSQHFAALYLLSHGAIKLWLIVGLWREKLAFYPAAITVFGMFIGYQLYRYSFTGSPALLLITALDLAVIGLTWFEFQHLRRLVPAGCHPPSG